MVDGARLTDISHAIELGTLAAREKFGRHFGIVAGYGGHGIGCEMHLDPFLANEGPAGSRAAPGRRLDARDRADAHAGYRGRPVCSTTTGRSSPTTAAVPRTGEHTVAVTADGPRILTLRP